MFYFFNGGDEEVYIGSADWMQRNLTRRVEAIVQVEDPTIAKELQEILGVMLADNRQAWDLQPGGHYSQRRPPANCPEVSSQQILMDMVMN
jgi:polyphosphate kinase